MGLYLVTGGAGFIGSHLSDSLIADGHAVRVLDDLSTGLTENLPPEADLVEGDVTKPEVVRRALMDVDGCFHLAAIASVARCQRDWLRSHAVNLGGTVTVFDEVRQIRTNCSRPVRVVYASSAAVYGNTTELPIGESITARPASSYAVDKYSSELNALVASDIYDLDTVGLRFFNIYGPRQDPTSPYSGVISIFCRRLSERLDVEIHGDGTQIRDFVYVGDAVTALRRAMAASAKSKVFNVCTGTGTSVIELASRIAQTLGAPLRPRYLSPRSGDVRMSVGDPRRAANELGFTAMVTLKEGLNRTLVPMSTAAERKCDDRTLVQSTR